MTTQTKESPPTGSPSQSATPLEGQALVDALKKQLEFYFSPQNLATDAYLTSRMNAQKYVPIDVIANFRKVKYLTEDRELLLKVMRQCKNLACDETGKYVRPTMKMERKTLLLRDIPSNTTEEEVRGIFDEHCGKVVSVRGDIGDTWYVTFETEDDCINTAMYLNSKMFKGKPIRCRVKSENLLRGYFFHSPTRDPSQRWGEGYYDLPPMGYPYHDPYAYADPHWQGYPDHGEMTHYEKEGRRGGRRGGDSRKNRGGGARRKKGYRKHYTEETDKSAPPAEADLGPEHFPALPSAGAAAAAATKKPASLVGYSKPFLKYSREHMASVVEQLNQKGFPKPESFEGHDSVVIRSTPSTSCQLMVPFPVMYPASPSPFLAAQPHHSSQLPSYLYLGGFEDVEALPLPEHSFSIPHGSQSEFPTTHSLSGSLRPEMDGQEAPKGQDTKLLDMLHEENSSAAAKKAQQSSSMRDEAKAKGPPAEGKSSIMSALKSEPHSEAPKSAAEQSSKGKGKPQKPRSGQHYQKSKKKQSDEVKSDSGPKLSYAEMARRAPQVSPVKKSSATTTK